MITLGECYRAAGGNAVLIALEVSKRKATLGGKEGVGIELGIAQELVKTAVQLIRARLIDKINDAAGGPAELGRAAVRLDGEFLYRIDRWIDGEGLERTNKRPRRGEAIRGGLLRHGPSGRSRHVRRCHRGPSPAGSADGRE